MDGDIITYVYRSYTLLQNIGVYLGVGGLIQGQIWLDWMVARVSRRVLRGCCGISQFDATRQRP